MEICDLNELKKHLPRGWGRAAAKRMNVSPATITNVMSGKNSNQAVIECLISMAEENKLLKQSLKERIKNLEN